MSTDSLGRLIRSTEYDANNAIVQRTEHLYDEYSRLSSQSWTIYSPNANNFHLYYNQPVEIGAYWFSNDMDHSQYMGFWGGYYGFP